MNSMLWNAADHCVDQDVQAYMAGDDVLLDRHLFLFDIEASKAHVRGLVTIDVLSTTDGDGLCEALDALAHDFKSGTFTLDDRFEDGHSAIEWYLTHSLGELGARVHLGRSRNDQVLVAQRLFMRSMLRSIASCTRDLAAICIGIADDHRDTVMPGYTHLQRAVPSTVGLWMASAAEALLDDAALLQMTMQWLDACPLGTAAGYGVNIPLAREQVADELGFDRVLVNPMHAQNSRGKFELQALSACWQVLQTMRRISWDLVLFASGEFGFVIFDDNVSTGSSIMPNKRNPDLAELVRGAAAQVGGSMATLQQLVSLPSGYQRDLQGTKRPIVESLLHTQQTLEVSRVLLTSMTFDRQAMRDAIEATMLATDDATNMAVAGMSFRAAHHEVAARVRDGIYDQSSTPEASVAARTSPGGCADLQLDHFRQRHDALCAAAAD